MKRQQRPRPVPAWWSEADASELDCLLYELVRCAFSHREGCDDCKARTECVPLREGLREALDAILDWKKARELRSRAEWMRERSRAQVAA